jgi:hypothetical protein
MEILAGCSRFLRAKDNDIWIGDEEIEQEDEEEDIVPDVKHVDRRTSAPPPAPPDPSTPDPGRLDTRKLCNRARDGLLAIPRQDELTAGESNDGLGQFQTSIRIWRHDPRIKLYRLPLWTRALRRYKRERGAEPALISFKSQPFLKFRFGVRIILSIVSSDRREAIDPLREEALNLSESEIIPDCGNALQNLLSTLEVSILHLVL